MKMLSLPITLFCMVFSLMAQAGLDAWTAYGPEGGMIQVVSIDAANPNIIYAGSANNGIYRSIDSGGNWSAVNNGLATLDIQVITIDPNLSTTLYAGTATGGIYKSTNSGDTWVAINTGVKNLNIYAIKVDSNNSDIIYAGTFGSVIQSTDGGMNWAVKGNNANTTRRLYYNSIYDLELDPSNSNTVYVSTASGGVWRSLNAGEPDWDELNNGLADATVTTRFFSSRSLIISSDGNTLYVGTQSDGILRSTDTAASWTPVTNTNNGLTTDTIRTLAMLPADTSIVYAGTTTGLFFTRDSGATWAEASTEMNVQDIIINPADPTELFAGTTEGVFRSVDSGVNWTVVNNGIRSFAVTDVIVHPANPNIQYVSSRNSGVAKTTDGGASWSFVNAGIADLHIQTMTVSSDIPETLYTGSVSGGVFKTFDGGTNWSAINSGLGNVDVRKLIIDPNQPYLVYAGTRAGISLLVDEDRNNNGNLDAQEDINNNGLLDSSWNTIIDGIAGQHDIIVNTLIIDPNNTSTMLSSTASSGIFISTDSGANWNNTSVGLTNEFIYAMAITPGDSNTIYAGTRGSGLFKSIDGGMSWFAINAGLANNDSDGIVHINAIVIDSAAPATVYVGTQDNGVFKSMDAGSSWVSLNNGLVNTTINSLTFIASSAPPMLLAGTEGDGVFEIQPSTTSVSSQALESDVRIRDDNGSGGGGIIFSSLLMLLGLAWPRLSAWRTCFH